MTTVDQIGLLGIQHGVIGITFFRDRRPAADSLCGQHGQAHDHVHRHGLGR